MSVSAHKVWSLLTEENQRVCFSSLPTGFQVPAGASRTWDCQASGVPSLDWLQLTMVGWLVAKRSGWVPDGGQSFLYQLKNFYLFVFTNSSQSGPHHEVCGGLDVLASCLYHVTSHIHQGGATSQPAGCMWCHHRGRLISSLPIMGG